ncbi:hypothetical protein NC653_007690 [Populus alba x Populus x berolinensis]|uniref:Uncharacterized protein n=1 Tax=Populus alba x Populus x berolinensis TaxID=444605 RepID=A0AAD6RI07_9ROSI|nr:hypothetical protein NC653_007690 [Populus alba x Populus x berolinensis]
MGFLGISCVYKTWRRCKDSRIDPPEHTHKIRKRIYSLSRTACYGFKSDMDVALHHLLRNIIIHGVRESSNRKGSFCRPCLIFQTHLYCRDRYDTQKILKKSLILFFSFYSCQVTER